MTEVFYATGNAIKFQHGQQVCKEAGIELVQADLDVPEIQGTNTEVIARDKAEKAFLKFGKPIIISDDSWSIPGLNGFPGAYMKDVNEWFSVQDWLNLTLPLTDRHIILRQSIVFQDASGQHFFSGDIQGVLLTVPRGESKFPHAYITSVDGGKTSTAEHHAIGKSAAASDILGAWHDFTAWYTTI